MLTILSRSASAHLCSPEVGELVRRVERLPLDDTGRIRRRLAVAHDRDAQQRRLALDLRAHCRFSGGRDSYQLLVAWLFHRYFGARRLQSRGAGTAQGQVEPTINMLTHAGREMVVLHVSLPPLRARMALNLLQVLADTDYAIITPSKGPQSVLNAGVTLHIRSSHLGPLYKVPLHRDSFMKREYGFRGLTWNLVKMEFSSSSNVV